MKKIGELLQKPQEKSNARSRRDELITEFIEGINKERPTTYKNLQGKKVKLDLVKPRFVAIKLSHLSVPELEWFLSECKDSRNRTGSFSKRFFGSLKVINTP